MCPEDVLLRAVARSKVRWRWWQKKLARHRQKKRQWFNISPPALDDVGWEVFESLPFFPWRFENRDISMAEVARQRPPRIIRMDEEAAAKEEATRLRFTNPKSNSCTVS